MVPTPAEACQFSQVDLALLRIEPLKGAELPVVPIDWTTPQMTKPPVLVVGHPCNNEEYRAKYDAERDDNSVSFDEVFGNQWQCKHASPGYGMPYFLLERTEREQKTDRFHPECGYIHDASTLGGNSGSPVLTLLGEHRAIGLHFWGQAATSADQVANLAHVLGAVLDAPNLATIREHGSTLREVLAAGQVAGVDSNSSPIVPPLSRGEAVSAGQSGPGVAGIPAGMVDSGISMEGSVRSRSPHGKLPRSPQSH